MSDIDHLCYYLSILRGTAFSYWFTGTLYICYMLIPCHTLCSLSGSPLPAFFSALLSSSEQHSTKPDTLWRGDTQKVRNGANFLFSPGAEGQRAQESLKSYSTTGTISVFCPSPAGLRASAGLRSGGNWQLAFLLPYHFGDRSLLFLSSNLK